MTLRYFAGLDLGSTGVKVLVCDADGAEVLVDQRPTPWTSGDSGTTEMDPARLTAIVVDLLASAADALIQAAGTDDVAVDAIAISGMGETGVLVDAAGASRAPAFAWFDPRGREQVKALPNHLRDDFPGRTGLPLGAQASVAKMLYLRDAGLDLSGLRWLNLPEFVATRLGARAVSELSLASRTGLLDQDTGLPWDAMLDYLGVPDTFLPPTVAAGTHLGSADAEWLPALMRGAAVTVAGHDHLVAAVSGGTIPGSRYQVSMGTAEVILRVLDEPLSREARARLSAYLVNCVRHVVADQYVLVAGVKTGLIMRRALQLFGIEDRAGRDGIDSAVLALPPGGRLPDGAIDVTGARNDDGVLSLTIRADGVSPAEAFRTILEHGNDEIEILLAAMEREVPPATSTLLSGGWASMDCVREARSRVLPDVAVSTREQDTAFGAAMAAAALAQVDA